MSILSGPEIERLVDLTRRKLDGPRAIEIEPFNPKNCGPNSYDVTLSPQIGCYVTKTPAGFLSASGVELDMKKENPFETWTIPETGYTLEPGRLYLGSTVERTACRGLVPWFDGRSSVGRLGLFVHVTAGRGDDGFDGTWTLEMAAVQPIRIYAGVRIGQISFMTLEGESCGYRGKYSHQSGPRPSELWRDFLPEGSK